MGPEKGYKDDHRANASFLPRQAETTGVVPPEEEKALGRSNCGLLMPKRGSVP